MIWNILRTAYWRQTWLFLFLPSTRTVIYVVRTLNIKCSEKLDNGEVVSEASDSCHRSCTLHRSLRVQQIATLKNHPCATLQQSQSQRTKPDEQWLNQPFDSKNKIHCLVSQKSYAWKGIFSMCERLGRSKKYRYTGVWVVFFEYSNSVCFCSQILENRNWSLIACCVAMEKKMLTGHRALPKNICTWSHISTWNQALLRHLQADFRAWIFLCTSTKDVVGRTDKKSSVDTLGEPPCLGMDNVISEHKVCETPRETVTWCFDVWSMIELGKLFFTGQSGSCSLGCSYLAAPIRITGFESGTKSGIMDENGVGTEE